MKSRKGFTLIELIVVVMIVAILAAVAIPLMTANTNRAKKTEAMAALGTIRTALRMYSTEEGTTTYPTVTAGAFDTSTLNRYVANSDFAGKYYVGTNYSVAGGSGTYTISASAPTGITGTVTLDSSGNFSGN